MLRMQTCLALVAGLLVPVLWAQEPPATAPAEDAKGALKEFRAVEKTIDKDFAKCKRCGGKGQVNKDRCEDCGGTGSAFHGDYQVFIDNYIAYCDLRTKHAAVLDADESARKRVDGNQKQYLAFIHNKLGPRTFIEKIPQGRLEAKYGRSETVDSPYDKLACDILQTTKNRPVGHGIAFSGRVHRVLPGSDGRSLAEITIRTTTGESRTRYVLVPENAKWDEGSRARVIGKVIAGDAERQAFELKSDALVVAPYEGTE